MANSKYTNHNFYNNLTVHFAFFCENSVDAMKARLGDDIVRCVGYGHIGDGNMHLNITSRQYNQEVMDKIEPYLYQWTSEQKGSISAEHGMIQLSFLFQWSRNQQCNSLFIFHFVLPILPFKITQPKR